MEEQVTKDALNAQDLVALILAVGEDMIAAKDMLTELDAAIGDGDLGITITLGFRAIQATLQDTEIPNLEGVLFKCGMAFADHAASTFGTLMATMFISGGRVAKAAQSVGAAEVAAMLQAATEGVQKRGKASLGDKTVLDAMIPASKVFAEAVAEGHSLPSCLAMALRAAEEGADKTIGMRSQAGRSSWLGERTIGVKDPGAAAFVLLLESANRHLRV